MSKIIVRKEELKNKMIESIDLLCDTVKSTLGPKGKNVIIDGDYLSPYITNDGVTIAEQIESDDPVISSILKIAKEASVKTNEVVGDGTTTSLVLLQSIFKEAIKSNVNAMMLKKDIDESLVEVIDKIKSHSIIPNKKDIISVATISSGDKIIGSLVGNAYNEVGINGVVSIEESVIPGIKLDLINGMVIHTNIACDYMLNKPFEFLIEPYILVTNHKISDIDVINNLINEVHEEKKPLLIIAESFSDDVLSSLVLSKEQGIIDVYAVNAPNYSQKQYESLIDICIFTGTNLVSKYVNRELANTHIYNLGKAKKIKIEKDKTTIIDGNNNERELVARINFIEGEIVRNDSQFEKEYLLERCSNLKSKSAIISVGASTKTELIEKKMRIEDAVCACASALKNGVLPGGGITLLRVSEELTKPTNSVGMKILLNSLKEPFKQIMNNIGLNYEEVLEKVQNAYYTCGIDAFTLQYVDLAKNGIFDSTEVVLSSLINAESIATMLLTTESLIVNTSHLDN